MWLRCGSYAAQHLTEGTVPGVVVQLYGTAPQARKLVAAGLWHAAEHACPRCPQPPAGDYVMHDYLVYNPTRARVEDDRAKAAERQARGRARAAEQRTAAEKRADSSPKTDRSDDESSAESETKAPRIKAGCGTNPQVKATRHTVTVRDRHGCPDPTRP